MEPSWVSLVVVIDFDFDCVSVSLPIVLRLSKIAIAASFRSGVVWVDYCNEGRSKGSGSLGGIARDCSGDCSGDCWLRFLGGLLGVARAFPRDCSGLLGIAGCVSSGVGVWCFGVLVVWWFGGLVVWWFDVRCSMFAGSPRGWGFGGLVLGCSRLFPRVAG